MTGAPDMKLINIIRYIKGYVQFNATGGFPERFINLCNVYGIRIWNLEPSMGCIRASVSAANFMKLRKAAKNSGVKIRITNKCGLPFLIRKHRNRMILAIGAIFFLVFIFIMNQFVWIIEVTGTQAVSHEEIIHTAAEYGLYNGAFVPTLDEAAISRSCVNYFKNKIVWMAVNIKGSKAVIEVRDFKKEREDTTYGEPCNIVADFDGKIISIETHNGKSEITEGIGVKKGDLLISGVIENTDMSCDYLEARGKITALHSVSFKKHYDKITDAFSYMDCTDKKYRINFLWADLPLYISTGNQTDMFGFSEYMTYRDIKLPFGAERQIQPQFHKKTYYDTDFLLALDNYVSCFYNKFRNTNLLKTVFSVSESDKKYIINAESECIDFIGEQRSISVIQ